MALIKCPRCELNYMNDTDKMCSVCRREVRGESEQYSECGENPVVPGQELCAYCLKEFNLHSSLSTDDTIEHAPTSIEIDSVASLEEIELDIHGDIDGEAFDDDADFDDEDDMDEDE